ncbi:CHAT domain-containing protein [Microcoleus sp. PH2017_30_WIL_O_A]|uniref:CHAT domain-containing protein n=1 Tax=Microcoleus sp. PH2017_30_WIL_O_A TaxID=2798840 RepID=UPI001DE22211|nr:CHAT domain-containing protein [Microcoleus sp. PH2017_30_WIL_O_A]MCC3582650.1 CHAT domain-containing protein [Microcoleus sp. PH2017_30_WIL_O_A]
MAKLVILKLGDGNFDRGFPVILQVGEEGFRPSIEVTGQLPPNSEIVEYYKHWQLIYRSLTRQSRLEKLNAKVTSSSELIELIENCRNAAEILNSNLESWLNSETFRPIKERLLEKLSPSEPIRVIIQTADLHLRRLPWHLWKIFDRYSLAEVALSSPNYEKIAKTNLSPHKKVKILAILGNSQGIDINADRQYLESLPRAEITFLAEPQRKDINDSLWEQNWDILFFAGHSKTDKEIGRIYINSTDSLTIGDLKEGLRKTIGKGLQLAIFNSCDGLGLARDLEDLHIPQIIVMREPIPDKVAQEFLKYFLSAFSSGQSLYLAVRQARERLRSSGLDDEIPGATWLPIICQNLAATPLTWPGNHKKLKPKYFWLVIACVAVLISVIGGIVVAKNFSLLSGWRGQSSEIANNKSYQNPSYGFKIEYPSNWEFQKIEDPTTQEVVNFSPLNELNSKISSQVRVIIMVEFLNTNMSLDEYRKSSENQIKTFLPDGKIIESSGTVLAKQQAYRLVYSGKNQQNDLVQKMEVVTLYKRKAYVITYEAEVGKYPDRLNTFSEMIKSFEIIDSDK